MIFSWKPRRRTPKMYIENSIDDLNQWVAKHLEGDIEDSICIAFADDELNSALYFFIGDGGYMGYIIANDMCNSISETGFQANPRRVDCTRFEDEYDAYLAKFKVYCLESGIFKHQHDMLSKLREEVMHA